MALLSTKSTKLPSRGTPLDIYYVTDTKETFLVAGDGVLLNVRDILKGTTDAVRAVGPQGQPGRDGGRGEVGAAGRRDCRAKTPPWLARRVRWGRRVRTVYRGLLGKMATDVMAAIVSVPGPQGPKGEKGDTGAKGDKGERGDVTVVGDSELLSAVETLRGEKARMLAKLIGKISEMGDHPVYRLAKLHLEEVLREAR